MSIEMKSLRSIGRLAIASLLVPMSCTAATDERKNAAADRRADASSAPSAELLEEVKRWKLDDVAEAAEALGRSGARECAGTRLTTEAQGRTPSSFTTGATIWYRHSRRRVWRPQEFVARLGLTRNGRADGPWCPAEIVTMAIGKDPPSSVTRSGTSASTSGSCSRPVFEWRLMGGPAGHPIDLDRYIAIYDVKDWKIRRGCTKSNLRDGGHQVAQLAAMGGAEGEYHVPERRLMPGELLWRLPRLRPAPNKVRAEPRRPGRP